MKRKRNKEKKDFSDSFTTIATVCCVIGIILQISLVVEHFLK